jgi:hypothetical protein
MRISRVLSVAILLILHGMMTAACAEVPPIGGMPSCKADAPAPVAKAICDIDFFAFDEAIRRELGVQDTKRSSIGIKVLEQLWREDRKLGIGLPWSGLREVRFKSVVVEHLATAIREGRSDIALAPLQRYAIDLAPKDLHLGIYLIGATNAPGQWKLLSEVIQTDRQGQRRWAIFALAEMCGSEPDRLLRTAAEDKSLDANDRQAALVALDQRSSVRAKNRCTPHKRLEPGLKL